MSVDPFKHLYSIEPTEHCHPDLDTEAHEPTSWRDQKVSPEALQAIEKFEAAFVDQHYHSAWPEEVTPASAGTHLGGGVIDIESWDHRETLDVMNQWKYGKTAAFLASLQADPGFAKAYQEAGRRFERSITVACPFGNCAVDIDPQDGKIFGGAGDPFCGCDNLPGWRSSRYEGLPKPGWSGKAKGRHGSRVQRSRHRRREWKAMVKDVERESRAWYAEQASWYQEGLS